MIFVDTGVWFAAYAINDPDSTRAARLLATPPRRLITTDYVIDELLTLFTVRGYREVAKNVGRLLFAEVLCEVIWTTRADIDAAWQVFCDYQDKAWSFTDCVSHAVMQRLGVTEAFSLDAHFRQFGFASVQP